MDIFGVLTLFGGLALFLYGMSIMGNCLEKVSGGKLEQILERLTSNRIKGVLLGAAVTAVIQSSSATTVMVVGFVNSGIMKLSQAIGLIMGANIGTTVTAWLLSLTGIDSSNFFLKMLNPSSFSPILAVIGILLFLGGKKGSKKDIGQILLGFAVLMFGMETMSNAVAPLADVPEFTSILTLFSNPLFGVLAGAVLTGIIQSSSASVGILQALSMTGGFTYGSVIPIIMGQNIGTCVTAVLSCLSGNRDSKRTALVHLYFNIIGTIIFLSLYYILNAIIHFTFTDMIAGPGGIALIHSIFNIFTTLVLLPFTQVLEKLAYMTLPLTEKEAKSRENRFRLLDERYLNSPAYALDNTRKLAADLADIAKQSVNRAADLLISYNPDKQEELSQLEENADIYEDRLNGYLSKLSAKNISYKDSQLILVLQHSITDLERITDLALDLGRFAKQMNEQQLTFSKKGLDEISVCCSAVREISDLASGTFSDDSNERLQSIGPLEEVIDNLCKTLYHHHMKRLRRGKCSAETGMILADISATLERIADHCSNISIFRMQLFDETLSKHTFAEQLDIQENKIYQEKYQYYKQLYSFK